MKRLQEYIHKLYEFENRAEYDRWFERKLQTSDTELSVISENDMEDGSIIVEIRMAYPCMKSTSWHCRGSAMTEYARYNTIDYKFVTEDDGWVSIYEYDKYSNTYFPVIQAADMAHAIQYCVLREPLPVQVNFI